jgi:hypothetical protein
MTDTYFFDYKEAYKEARKQNKFTIFNNLQICYYNGDYKQTPYENLIHLPVDQICDYMSETPNRGISEIKFTKNFSQAQQQEITIYIDALQKIAWKNKNDIGNEYRKLVKEQKLDFSEPLRILFITTRGTTVLQYVAKNLSDAFNDLGYSTFISIEQNAMQNWGGNDSHGNANFAWHLKNIYEYNPHIIFNLDWLNNTFLNDEVFNFVWFQDPMEILYNDEEIRLRDRDFVYSLSIGLHNDLNKKNVYNQYQSFCVNDKIFKPRSEIIKSKKIVFIGTSYIGHLQKYINDVNFQDVLADAITLFEQTSCLKTLKHDDSEIKYLMDKHNKSEDYINEIYRHLARDYCVEKLCQIDTDYEIEIYGRGWEDNDIVRPYFKGIVEYGEDISKIYNSATYGFCPGGYVLMQRTLECALSGTIPLVLDARADKQDIYDKRIEDEIQFFHINKLEEILKEEPKHRKSDLLQELFSYKGLANKILKTVKESNESNSQ